MTSNDLIIIEAINGLENKVVSLQQEIKDTKQELLTEIKINTVKIDAVHQLAAVCSDRAVDHQTRPQRTCFRDRNGISLESAVAFGLDFDILHTVAL